MSTVPLFDQFDRRKPLTPLVMVDPEPFTIVARNAPATPLVTEPVPILPQVKLPAKNGALLWIVPLLFITVALTPYRESPEPDIVEPDELVVEMSWPIVVEPFKVLVTEIDEPLKPAKLLLEVPLTIICCP